jgi:drug/metabolite transporter (DMT)-like permease
MVPFVAVAGSTGAVLTLLFEVEWTQWDLLEEQKPLILLMMAVGMAGQTAMVLNGSAMRAEPAQMATTWTLFQMAMVMPFLAATLIHGEEARIHQWLAVPLIGAAIALLAPRRPAVVAGESHGLRLHWLKFMIPAFLFAGLTQSMAQEASLRGIDDPMDLRVPVSLGAGACFLWTVKTLRGAPLERAALRLSAPLGFVVAAGNMLLYRALDAASVDDRTFMIFPIAVCGSVMAFTAFQCLFGQERVSVRKAAGLVAGLVGAALLTAR